MRPIDADAITYCNYDLDNYHSRKTSSDFAGNCNDLPKWLRKEDDTR